MTMPFHHRPPHWAGSDLSRRLRRWIRHQKRQYRRWLKRGAPPQYQPVPVPEHMIGRRILGLTFDGRPIFEPKTAGSSLTLAAAGGGKTTCVSVPALMSMLADTSRAVFTSDSKDGEIAAQVGGMCRKHGRLFAVVDEFAALGEDNPARITLNPFGAAVHALKVDPEQLPFVIANIVHALIEEPADDQKNFYWREAPREILTLGILILLELNPSRCFPGALAALLADPDTWARALREAADSLDASLSASARQLQEMKQDNPEHYSQHMRAALTSLKIFATGPLKNAGRLAQATHAELIEKGAVVCFVNPARFTDRLGPFYALHFLALMNAQLRHGAGRSEFILDEFCNAPLRDALNRVTIQRAFGARSHFIAQSRQDIVRKYGEKETALLEENCSIIQYLKFSNYEEAERISRAMGETIVISPGLGLASNQSGWNSNYSTGQGRVFTADELMRLPPDEQILQVDGVGFIHCRKFYQSQFAPYCFELAANPLEGGRLPPDPRVVIAGDE